MTDAAGLAIRTEDLRKIFQITLGAFSKKLR